MILQGPDQIHVSKFYKDAKIGKFISYISEDARTLYETFRRGSYESNNGPCLGWRDSLTSPYQVITMQSMQNGLINVEWYKFVFAN